MRYMDITDFKDLTKRYITEKDLVQKQETPEQLMELYDVVFKQIVEKFNELNPTPEKPSEPARKQGSRIH